MPYLNTKIRIILEYIQAHPGAARADILTVLPADTKPGSVSCLIQRLHTTGAIENRGRGGKLARWYPVETSDKPEYHTIAEDLLEDLKTVHHAIRAEYLALRLEEIFGD